MGVALVILLAGCSDAPWPGARQPQVLAHSASIRPDNALIAEVEISLSHPRRVFVEYGNPDAGKFRTALSESGRAHTIAVARLRAEATYTYAIGVQDADGAGRLGPHGTFTTGPLPVELAAMHTRASGRSSEPLILTSYTAEHRGHAVRVNHLIFLDETGDVVWYYAPKPVKGRPYLGPGEPMNTIKQRANRNLIFIWGDCCITEITPLGEIVHQLQSGGDRGIPHHDFVLLDDGRILYPSATKTVFDGPANGGEKRTSAFAETLRVWDPGRGRVEQIWDSRDHWDIASAQQWDLWEKHDHDIEDGELFCWLHVNSMSFGPRGNLILSLRHRQQVVSIAADLKTIEWQLGGPDSGYDFPNPDDRFHVQHQATELPNGNILLFDNGLPKAKGGTGYSRALELRLDDERRSATKVWEYRPDIMSPIVSGATRLGNGNTLVNFGFRSGAWEPLIVIEVDPQGNELFRAETVKLDRFEEQPSSLLSFRAVGGIGSIMGEIMLRAPAVRTPAEAFPPDREYWSAMRQQHREHRLNRHRMLYESLVAGDLGEPLVRTTFNIHRSGRTLTYFKGPCEEDDTLTKFLLHVFPADKGHLTPKRRRFGFETLDFHFAWSGEFVNGGCVAQRVLPDYPISHIRTGQFVDGDAPTWQVELRLNRQRALYKSLVAGDLGEPMVRSTFNIHRSGRTLSYFKVPCEEEDTQTKFLLHVFPVDEGDLAPNRRLLGFENLDFHFARSGEFVDGGCIAQRMLPDYPISHIRTGQFADGEAPLWRVELPVQGETSRSQR